MCVLFLHGCGLDHCNFASSFQSPKYFQLQKLMASNDSFQTSSEQEKLLASIKRQVACWRILEIRPLLLFMLLHHVAIYTIALNYCQQKCCSQADFCVQRRSDIPPGMLMLGEQRKLTDKVMKWKHLGYNDIKRYFHPCSEKVRFINLQSISIIYSDFISACVSKGDSTLIDTCWTNILLALFAFAYELN